ncbi:pilin subunit UpsB [Sulfuracidifex tepidarius]
MPARKAISSVFSSLIVVAVTLSLIPPLMIYFNQANSSELNISNNMYREEQNMLLTKISLIDTGNNMNQLYIYNYGNSAVNISKIFINKVEYKVSFSLPENGMVKLSSLVNFSKNVNTVGICANGNLYVFYVK